TGEGITSSAKYDTAMLNRSEGLVRWEKRLAVCEIDGAVVAAADHLKWIAERVHELGYSNPALIISATAELGVGIEPSPRADDAEPGRGDEFRVLCPECRRAVLLREAWG
ncbi:unnamed protein product, partial [marine sediment metagenome]